MIRRICSPISGPIIFFLVAGLEFAGLAWVTVAALRVEESRRDAAVENEQGHNLRIALWRLDGRMLSPLSVEDNRPYHHYAGGEVPAVYGPGSAPLLDAPLPDWMRLHFQVDPEAGWSSPQVMPANEVAQCRQLWPGLTLRNVNADKSAMLADLKAKFPARQVTEGFAFRERTAPEDGPPAPLYLDNFNPVPESLQPYPNSAPRGLNPNNDPGAGLPPVTTPPDANTTSSAVTPEYRAPLERFEKGAQQTASQQPTSQAPLPRPAEQLVQPSNGRGNYRVPNESQSEYQKRADIGRAAANDAKSAQNFPLTQNSLNYNPMIQNPGTGNGVLLNSSPGTNPMNRPGVSGGGFAAPTSQPMGTILAVPVPGGPLPPSLPTGGPGNYYFENSKDRTARDNELPKESKSTEDRGWFGRRNALMKGTDGIESYKKLEDAKPLKDGTNLRNEDYDGDTICFFSYRFRSSLGRNQFMDDRIATGGNTAGVPVLSPDVPNPVPVPLLDRPAPPSMVHLGSIRPQWITAADGTDVLVFVRTARIDNRTVYQGVVVDWKKLEESLRDDVKDLFPEATLLPVKDPAGVSPERAMTALPVQLDPGPTPAGPPLGWTPLRLGLALAWVAAFIAFAAVGFSGWSILDLAERRIRFVSAVTHELRTPLTSLRLYLDLLLSGMVKDEEKRNEYLATLNTESDRLHRLIDNVLDFARLEKRRKASDSQPVRIADFLEQVRQTWAERCGTDDKELVVISTLTPDEKVNTDPQLVQQIVGNLIDNARKYTRDAADKRIWLWAKPGGRRRMVFEVEDRGVGVPVSEQRTIFKPFRRGEAADTIAGGAGLGLALAKQWAELLGGRLTYRPADGGVGACFRLELRLG